jgi:hypothetical protein
VVSRHWSQKTAGPAALACRSRVTTGDLAGLFLLFLHPGEEDGGIHGLGRLRLGAVEHAHDDDGGGVNVERQLDLLAGG